MIKKTKENFAIVVSILKHKCFMNEYQAAEKAKAIFNQVNIDRKNGLKTTVEHYLLYEINSIE